MAQLKTNYVDDILDTSVNTQRKYNMVNNADGTFSFEDVTVYSQTGDTFGAKDVNEISEVVNTCLQIVSFDADTGTLVTKSADYTEEE